MCVCVCVFMCVCVCSEYVTKLYSVVMLQFWCPEECGVTFSM